MRRQTHPNPERRTYLQQLVTEFQDTDSKANKAQVLANLSNFAYDPQNYEYLRQLNVIELFLDQLMESDTNLVEFAIGGLCNLALDPTNKERIIRKDGIRLVIQCLSSDAEEVVLSAITTLMFLMTPQSKNEIVVPSVVECMSRFSNSTNRRLSNLAHVFLQDFCSTPQNDQLTNQ